MSETKKLLTRADLAKADTWATEDLYATDALWEETLATLKADTAVLASYAGKLSNADDLYAYLTKTEEVHVKLGRLGNYSSRKADEGYPQHRLSGHERQVYVRSRGPECGYQL